MTIWLNGNFWGKWIRKFYRREIEDLRDALLKHTLPALPNPEQEAEAYQAQLWDWVISQPCEEEPPVGESYWAGWVRDEAVDKYMRLMSVQQANINMGTVMLWHLVEQQILAFHKRQVLSMHEEAEASDDPKTHKKLMTLETFKIRLVQGGYDLIKLPEWQKVDELRIIANTVKHGAGASADRLFALRPDLFHPEGKDDGENMMTPRGIDRPAGGEDIYVTKSQLEEYFEAAIQFWLAFSTMIEAVPGESG